MNTVCYTDLDREIVVLAAVWDLIDSMVNYAHFEKGHRLEDAMLMFSTRESSHIFLIFLADFLSWPQGNPFGLTREGATEGSLAKTYLGRLVEIANAPHFQGDTSLLQTSTQDFAAWLDDSVTVEKVWLPSIEHDGSITIKRRDYLYICGTASKHGFTRLRNIVRDIQRVLEQNGTSIDEGDGYLIIPEFQEWFRDHVFQASASTIAAYLNDIRWGIFTYLQSEFERAFRPIENEHFPSYSFDVPNAITQPLIRAIYWDLMNKSRSQPYFPRFTPNQYLKDEF